MPSKTHVFFDVAPDFGFNSLPSQAYVVESAFSASLREKIKGEKVTSAHHTDKRRMTDVIKITASAGSSSAVLRGMES
ncbi:MAG: hypothetical protein IBX72_15435 [Nitrospirae bacterium]|nr:hypothetical protein [Nitrospirota bacterium]